MTTEQKDLLQNFQKQFGSQSDFVVHLLDLLQNGKQLLDDDSDCLKIPLNSYQRSLLEYVAHRESTEDVCITLENVLMYMFDEMFVKGNKFSIDSIPDSVIRKYKKEFSND